MPRFFITSSGTGIGKTLVTTALAWQLHQLGHKVAALKPVISGYDAGDANSDTALLLQSCGRENTPVNHMAISPWRFAAPLAPTIAAAKERKPQVALDELLAFCRKASGDYLLVEGVGGVMAPMNDRHTVLDWMSALGWPVIMVGGSYLGAISHVLSAIEAVRGRGLQVKALVVSESASAEVALADTITALEKFVPTTIPIVTLPRLDAPEKHWQHAPPLSWICI